MIPFDLLNYPVCPCNLLYYDLILNNLSKFAVKKIFVTFGLMLVMKIFALSPPNRSRMINNIPRAELSTYMQSVMSMKIEETVSILPLYASPKSE